MADANKRNLLYFESTSMKGLYNRMEKWQNENQKRLLSTNIQKDGDAFCCIALTNPTEVVICNGTRPTQAEVKDGRLRVFDRKEDEEDFHRSNNAQNARKKVRDKL